MKKEIEKYEKYMEISREYRRQAIAFISVGLESEMNDKGMNARQIAEKFGVTTQKIYGLVKMHRHPSPGLLKKLKEL